MMPYYLIVSAAPYKKPTGFCAAALPTNIWNVIISFSLFPLSEK